MVCVGVFLYVAFVFVVFYGGFVVYTLQELSKLFRKRKISLSFSGSFLLLLLLFHCAKITSF